MSFSHDDFLKALDQHDFSFEVGKTVRGRVANHSSDGAYVDIGGKSAALLPMQEVNLPADQPFEVFLPINAERDFMILRGQDENGQVVLSLRQLEIKALWEKLQTFEPGQTVNVRVTGTNKGGLMANYRGIRAFIPRSHVVQRDNIEELVGQQLTVSVLEADPSRKKLVLSQRQARRAQRMLELEVGQLVTGKVSDLRPFGAFVDLNGITGLLHINNISQKYVASLSLVLPVGTVVKAVVMELDEQKNRISLSTSVLENRPGEILEDFEGVMAEAEQRATRRNQAAEADANAEAPEPEVAADDAVAS